MARGPQARPWGRAAIGLLARFEHKTAMLRFSTRISTVALLALAALAASVTGARAEFRLLSGDANDQPNAEFVVAADVSPSGRYVLFQAQPPVHGSAAGIDVAGLYRRDLVTGALEFVGDNSVANGGVIESSISDDGRYIAWSTSPDGSSINHIYWRDTVAGTTRHLTSGADGRSGRPLLSADGLQVAFLSEARNLVADTSKLPAAGRAAVYRWNATNQQTEVISLASTGNGLAAGVGPNSTLAAALLQWDFSRDGNWLVFTSDGTDVTPEAATSATFVWLFRRNLGTGAVDVVNRNAAGTVASANYSAPSVSDDGNRVAFVGAFLGVLGTPISTEFAATFGAEALAKDMTTGDVYWVSRTLNGANLSAKVGDTVTRTELSGDGTVVAMTAISTNLPCEQALRRCGRQPRTAKRRDVAHRRRLHRLRHQRCRRRARIHSAVDAGKDPGRGCGRLPGPARLDDDDLHVLDDVHHAGSHRLRRRQRRRCDQRLRRAHRAAHLRGPGQLPAGAL
jgi:hypothetical protein